MATPTVTVIIAAYNAAKTIRACLESLKRQSIKHETIVVDDGSVDDTASVVDAITSIQLIKQAHRGVGAARNRGAEAAHGNILVFVDADMVFDLQFVEKLIEPIIHQNTLGTFTKDERVSNWENSWARCWNYEYTGSKTKNRISPQSPNTSPVFRAIRKKEFDAVGGFDHGGYDDDWSLVKKLGQPAVLAPGAVVYHRNPGSAKEVFNHAAWVATRRYKYGEWGRVIAFIRANPILSVLLGLIKAIRFQTPFYLLFKVVYNAGLSWGILKKIPVLVVFMALALRLVLINDSFWLDEAAQALESARPLSEQFNIIPDFQPPLYHLVVHFLTYVSLTNWWLRLASLVPGLITVWLTYKMGKVIANQSVALLASLFLATSQFHIFYSQELRPYALATMLATWSMYELIAFLQQKRSHLIFLTVINCLGLYTMYLYPFFMLAQLVILFVKKPSGITSFIGSAALSVLLFLPWMPTFLQQLSTGTGWLTSIGGWAQVVSPPIVKMLPLTLIKLLYGRINLDATIKDVLLVGLLGLPLVLSLKKVKSAAAFTVLSLWMAVPIVLAFIVSVKIPILDPKRVMFVLPALYLLIALGLTRIRHGLSLVILLLLINMINIGTYWTGEKNQREPWQPAIDYVEQQGANPAVLVTFAFPEPFAPWRWYANPALPTLSLVPQNESTLSLHAKLSLYTGYDTVIIFDYLMDLTDPDRVLHEWFTSHGYREVAIADFPNLGFVRTYSRAETYATHKEMNKSSSLHRTF